MARPKKEETEDNPVKAEISGEVMAILTDLVSELKTLKSKVESFEHKPSVSVTQVNAVKTEVTQAEANSQHPVPAMYRSIVDEALNQYFGIEVSARADAPLFEFSVIVPEQYSNMPKPQRELLKRDVRLKVFSYADGETGIKEYVNTIFNNFSPEIRAQIVADRT